MISFMRCENFRDSQINEYSVSFNSGEGTGTSGRSERAGKLGIIDRINILENTISEHV